MSYKIEISYDVDAHSWNNSLKENPSATAAQIAEYYFPHKLTYDSKPVYITILDSQGKIVGQLSGAIHFTDYWLDENFLSRSLSKLKLGSTLRWSQGPIIHDYEHMQEILSNILTAIDKVAKENNVNVISGTTPPQIENFPVTILKKHGYQIIPWVTYITNLQRSVDEIFSSLHNKTRYDVRKGEKTGLEFEVASGKDVHKIYWNVKYHNEKKIKEIQKKYEVFADNIWKVLFQNGYKKNFVVKQNGEPVAVITNLLFNGNISQIGVANTPKGSNYAGSFLTWNSIRWAAQNNYKTYDVGGANPLPTSKKEEGINLFKSKWASDKIEYYICTKVVNKTKLNISKIIKQPSSLKNRINKKITRLN